MKKIKKIKFTIFLSLVLIFLLTTPIAFAQSDQPDNVIKTTAGLKKMVNEAYGGGSDVNFDITAFNVGLVIIVNFLLSLLGIVFFLLMVYAGYLWMTARGNEEQIEKAKKITKEAIVGLLIIVLARIATEFILTQVGKAIQT